MMMKKLGIIGGLGPMATAYFMQQLVEMTDASIEQEHIEMVIYNCPAIPDRTEYILGNSSQNPLPYIIDVAKKLALSKVDIIAVPCITAHYFYNELNEAIELPLINVIGKTAEYLKLRGYSKVGIMATDGTVKSRIFDSSLYESGLECLYPSVKNQSYVMELIYNNVKAGSRIDINKFHIVSEELFNAGAQLILLGCTELSVIKRNCNIGKGYLDVMEVLAQCCVKNCGKLKKQFEELVT